MKETITVTQEDIDKARKANGLPSMICPIAQAIHRKRSRKQWRVGSAVIITANGDNVPLPKRAVNFIERFDAEKKPVKPFSFTIEVPEK